MEGLQVLAKLSIAPKSLENHYPGNQGANQERNHHETARPEHAENILMREHLLETLSTRL
jgi:hypothetical protein